jgi:hypothetical protein
MAKRKLKEKLQPQPEELEILDQEDTEEDRSDNSFPQPQTGDNGSLQIMWAINRMTQSNKELYTNTQNGQKELQTKYESLLVVMEKKQQEDQEIFKGLTETMGKVNILTEKMDTLATKIDNNYEQMKIQMNEMNEKIIKANNNHCPPDIQKDMKDIVEKERNKKK